MLNSIGKMDICIIGAGRVGTTMAAVITGLDLPDIKIKAISSPTKQSRDRASKFTGDMSSQIFFSDDNEECARTCNCIMICTPDDIIEKVCTQLVKSQKFDTKGKIFIHFSGAKSLKVLAPADKSGGLTVSMHPVKSFASIDESIKTLEGTIYGVTFGKNSTSKLKSFIFYLVEKLKGSIIEVSDEKKSIYHASACIASNYLVSLINYAVKVNEQIGIKPDDSLKALTGLIEGTVSNIKRLGTKKSLTGPIARGDVGTIREHLENFNSFFDQEDYLVYKVMGEETAKLAFENGWINQGVLEEFSKLFSTADIKK